MSLDMNSDEDNQEVVADSVLVLSNFSYATPNGTYLGTNSHLPLLPNGNTQSGIQGLQRVLSNTAGGPDTFVFTDKDGTQYTFNVQGLQTLSVDRNGNITEYQYGTQIGPDGTADLLIAIVQQGGLTTDYAYDGDGDLESITDPYGRVTSFIVSGGQLTNVSLPDPEDDDASAAVNLEFGYEGDDNRLSSIDDGDGYDTTIDYDSSGRVTGGTNPDGGAWTFTSFLTSGLSQVQVPASGLIGNNDPNDTSDQPKATFVDPDGNTTTYQTDQFGLETAMADPTGAVWTWTRRETGSTADGLPTAYTEPQGGGGEGGTLGALMTYYAYDNSGDLTSITYPETINGNPVTESWGYGTDDQLHQPHRPRWSHDKLHAEQHDGQCHELLARQFVFDLRLHGATDQHQRSTRRPRAARNRRRLFGQPIRLPGHIDSDHLYHLRGERRSAVERDHRRGFPGHELRG